MSTKNLTAKLLTDVEQNDKNWYMIFTPMLLFEQISIQGIIFKDVFYSYQNISDLKANQLLERWHTKPRYLEDEKKYVDLYAFASLSHEFPECTMLVYMDNGELVEPLTNTKIRITDEVDIKDGTAQYKKRSKNEPLSVEKSYPRWQDFLVVQKELEEKPLAVCKKNLKKVTKRKLSEIKNDKDFYKKQMSHLAKDYKKMQRMNLEQAKNNMVTVRIYANLENQTYKRSKEMK